MDLAAWILEPFSLSFMQRALVSGVAVGISAPVIGVWAVTKRLVYLTDGMSHAILAGVVAAAALGLAFTIGGIVVALVMAALVVFLVLRLGLAEDSATGVVSQGLFAAGVVGATLLADPRALGHILFGNPLTVTWPEVATQGLLAIIVVAGCAWLAPAFAMAAFDPAHARTIGVRVGALDALLVISLALIVVIGLSTVGVLMCITLITAPAVAARLLTGSFATAMLTASILGVLASIAGLLVAYHISWPVGPTIALIAIAEVALASLIVLIRRGPAWRAPRQPSLKNVDARVWHTRGKAPVTPVSE